MHANSSGAILFELESDVGIINEKNSIRTINSKFRYWIADLNCPQRHIARRCIKAAVGDADKAPTAVALDGEVGGAGGATTYSSNKLTRAICSYTVLRGR